MTLLRVTKQLEKERAARADAGAPIGLGILWTVDHELLPEAVIDGMGPQQYVAMDLHLEGFDVDNSKLWNQVRGVERITSDVSDFGLVYDSDGEIVGSVLDRNRGLTTLSVLSRVDGFESAGHPQLVRGRTREVGQRDLVDEH